MPTSLIVQLLMLFTSVAIGFALWKGRTAERLAAVVVLANMAVAFAFPTYTYPAIDLTNDAVAASALLLITIRYGAPWMGGIMLFYAAQFTLHSYYLVADRPPTDYFHAVVNNVNFSGITWCLIFGTAVAWRRRRRERQPAAAVA
jgi:hypothetical protein